MSHTNSVNFKCDEILPNLTSIWKILSKQSTLSFLNNNRKHTHTCTHIYEQICKSKYQDLHEYDANFGFKHPKKGFKLASTLVLWKPNL